MSNTPAPPIPRPAAEDERAMHGLLNGALLALPLWAAIWLLVAAFG
jgi:hypothetical protein